MRRVAWLGAWLVTVAAAAQGPAPAEAAEREVVLAWALLGPLSARYEAAHPDVQAARRALDEAIARADTAPGAVDRAQLSAWVRERIAEVDARLAEMRASCRGGPPDVRGAQARRSALVDALDAIEAHGRFRPR